MIQETMAAWSADLSGDVLQRVLQRHPSAYLYSSEVLNRRCADLRAALPSDIDIFYSLKANPNVHLVREIRPHVQGAEVSSEGELAIARAAGFRPEDILFVGPAKSTEELAQCVELGLRGTVVESLDELLELSAIADARQKPVRVLLRINPEFRAEGAKMLMTGVSSQFGMEVSVLPSVVAALRKSQFLQLVGLHVYLGTRFLSAASIAANTDRILDLCFSLERELDVRLSVIDIGGGLGIPYFEGEKRLDLTELQAEMERVVRARLGESRTMSLILETGRYLVGEAGVYATTVRHVKESRGETWVLTHGGINHFYSSAFMGSMLRRNFPIAVLDRVSERAGSEEVNLCGPLCTPGDLLGSKVRLPRVGPGDVIGIFCAGAYAYSVSPLLFLSHDSPPEILLKRGDARVIRPVRRALDVLSEQLSTAESA